MWRTESDITTDLGSIEPARLAAGIRDLQDRRSAYDEFPLPRPDISGWLQRLGTPSEETTKQLHDVIWNYQGIEPEPDLEWRIDHSIQVGVASGLTAYALELALELRVHSDAPQAVGLAIASLGRLTDEQITSRWATAFIESLLGGQATVRKATSDHIRAWGHPHALRVLQIVTGQ